ncbi:MAG: thioesterase family protein [Pseudomonadota bacterium]
MTDAAAPLEAPIRRVHRDWIDYNGHMNMAFYNVVFDKAVDYLFDLLDIGVAYVERENSSAFTMEVHVTYAQEVVLDDPLRVTVQLIDFDAKRLHIFMEMHHAEDGYLAATMEQMAMHVDLDARRSAPFPEATIEKLTTLMAEHAQLEVSEVVGRVIGIRRKG